MNVLEQGTTEGSFHFKTMRHLSTERADAVILWLRDYASRRLDLALWDERRSIPAHVVGDFARVGLFGLNGEREFGGLNLSSSDCLRVSEQLGAIDLSLSISFLLQSFLVTPPIRDFASPEIKARWLPELVSGKTLGSYCLTERGAGSDPRRIQTSAHEQPNGDWVINGEKIWSGNAAWAGVLVVFARAFDTNGTERGISAFVVDRDTSGVLQGPEARTMGLRAMVQNSMRFENVRLQAGHILGAPGEGLRIAHGAMMFARLVIGAICLGALKRCLAVVLPFVRERRISTGPMANNPTVLAQLQGCFADCLALETLVEHAGRKLDEGAVLPDEWYAALKIVAPETLGRGVDTCLQLLGGRGFIETNTVARVYRDARVLRIFEGPTETLAAFLGARFRTNPAPFLDILSAFDGQQQGELLVDLLEEWNRATAALPLELQRARLLRGQVLLGELAARALSLAALGQNPRAGNTMKLLATKQWRAQLDAFTSTLDNTPDEGIVDELDRFCAPTGHITPFFAGEDWQGDEMLKPTGG